MSTIVRNASGKLIYNSKYQLSPNVQFKHDPEFADNIMIVDPQLGNFSESYQDVTEPATSSRDELFAILTSYLLISQVQNKDLSIDAFGRLRMSEPYTVFDNSHIYEASNSLFWSGLSSGTGQRTANVATSKQTLSVGANAGDYYVYQTKQRFKYQPGKSHQVLITGLFSTEADVIKRVGLMDVDNLNVSPLSSTPQNGIFFENNSGVLSFNIVNNGVITEKITRENWNNDKLTGLEQSAFTLDLDSTNILFIDFEWLGVGSVRVGFVSPDGKIIVAHQFQHASNGFADVYMRTPNLPVHYSIISGGGAGSMKAICCSVTSEGGFNSTGIIQSIPPLLVTPSYLISAGDTELITGFRLKRNCFDANVIPLNFSAINKNSADAVFFIVFNPTYNGSVSWVDLPNSNLQYAVNNNNVVTNKGIILNVDTSPAVKLASGGSKSEIDSTLRIGRDLAGNLDEIWLICEALDDSDVSGYLTIRDII